MRRFAWGMGAVACLMGLAAGCGDDDAGPVDAAPVAPDAPPTADAAQGPVDAALATDAAASDAVPSDAAPTELVAEGSFSVSNLCGLGYDHTTERVWAFPCSGAELLRFTAEGTADGTVARAGESANDVDIDIAPAAFTLGETAVPAGGLLFINGETGVAEVFLVDPTGTDAPVEQATAFGNSHVVGGAYHAGRGTIFLVQDRQAGAIDGNLVAEIDTVTGAVVNSFSVADEFIVNFGDIEVCQSSGHLLLVSSDETTMAELTPTGAFVGEYDLPAGVSGLAGIAIDDDTGEAWVAGAGTITRITGLPCDPS